MQNHENTIVPQLAQITRAGRKMIGLTQSELADRLGVTQGYISKLEKGLLTPSAILWFRFCETVKIPAYAGQVGYIDQGQKLKLSHETKLGLFTIPDGYAFAKGTAIRTSRPLITYFEKKVGLKRKNEFLISKGLDPDLLTLLDSALNINFNLDLIEELARLGYANEEHISEITSCMQTSHIHGELSRDYRYSKDPIEIFKAFEKNVDKYDINWNYSFEFSKENQVEIELTPKPHLKRFPKVDEKFGNFLFIYQENFFKQFLLDAQLEFQEMKSVSTQNKCVYQIHLKT